MTAADIASRLDASKSGEGFTGKCPAHDDGRASLSINDGAKGVVLHCHAGCSVDDICKKLNIEVRDLFNGNGARGHRGEPRQIVATYNYNDANGTLLYQAVRYSPKDFRQRRPDGKGGWIWNMEGVERKLYRLPEVLADLAKGLPVVICEGEKDVAVLVKAGFGATCNVGGAGKWQDAYSETFRGADVVIIADKDKPGRAHAQDVAQSLKGKARSVKVLELPDLNGKPVKDAHDYFSAGGDASGLVMLIDETPVYSGKELSSDDSSTEPGEGGEDKEHSEPTLPEIDNAASLLGDATASIPPEIVQGIIHQGLKGVLGSSSKARKTWILLDLAISVATGLPWWGRETKQGKVLYLNFEIPRAFIRSRIQTLCERKGIASPKLDSLDVWTLRGHAAALWRLLPELLERIQSAEYSLILIDPIYKALGGRDENKAGDISDLCNELERIAVQTGAAVMYAAHYSKGNQSGKEAIDRIGGSGVWTRDADTIITLTKHEQEGAFTVDMILRNLPEQEPFVVQWEYPVMTVADLNPEDLKQAPGRKPDHTPDDLLRVLPPAGLSNKAWEAAADEDGIGRRTYYRLRKALEQQNRVIQEVVSQLWKPIKSRGVS